MFSWTSENHRCLFRNEVRGNKASSLRNQWPFLHASHLSPCVPNNQKVPVPKIWNGVEYHKSQLLRTGSVTDGFQSGKSDLTERLIRRDRDRVR